MNAELFISEIKLKKFEEIYRRDFVENYIEVWKDKPWNEAVKCASCGKNFGREYEKTNNCPECRGALKPYWSKNKVDKDIDKALNQKDCEIILAMNKEKVIGFSYGYKFDEPKSGIELIESGPQFEQWKKVVKISYIEGLGVLKQFKGRGIGRKLLETITRCFEDKNYDMIVLGTLPVNGPAMNLYKSLGFEETDIEDPKWSGSRYMKKKLNRQNS